MKVAKMCSRDSLLKGQDATRRPLPPPPCLHYYSQFLLCQQQLLFSYQFLSKQAAWRKLYFPC